jgi:hypothetical protein
VGYGMPFIHSCRPKPDTFVARATAQAEAGRRISRPANKTPFVTVCPFRLVAELESTRSPTRRSEARPP